MDNLVYESFHDESPNSVAERLDWLGRQPSDRFRPQPYEQLAKVFRESGREEDARLVMIAKNDAKYASMKGARHFVDKLVMKAAKLYSNYGYSKSLPCLYVVALLVAGWGTFHYAGKSDVMQRALQYSGPVFINDFAGQGVKLGEVMFAPSAYPDFSPMIYALDALIPFVDLGQFQYWMPGPGGEWMSWFLCVYIPFGWILISLLIANLTGVFKK